MGLHFFIDTEELVKELKNFKEEAKAALEQGVKTVAAMTHAKVIELASSKLNSTRKIYLDNLDFEEIAPGIWVVSLDKDALWIEDGRKAGDMTEDLLRKGAHTAQDGSRYKAIPFDQAKAPSQQTPFQKNLTAKIKHELKREGLPFKKLELDANGSPRIGVLHRLNITSPRPSDRASHPALHGLTVSQIKGPSGKVTRQFTTFRIVSSKHKGVKWYHPGKEAEKFFEEALEWVNGVWENEIVPEIMKRFDK